MIELESRQMVTDERVSAGGPRDGGDTAGHLWTLNWIIRHYDEIQAAGNGLRIATEAARILRGGK